MGEKRSKRQVEEQQKRPKEYILGLDWKHAVTISKIISPSGPQGEEVESSSTVTYWNRCSPSRRGDCGDLSFTRKNKISLILDRLCIWKIARPNARPAGWQTTGILSSQSLPAHAFQKEQFLVDRRI